MGKLKNWIQSKRVKLIRLSKYNSLVNQLELKNQIINQKTIGNTLLNSRCVKLEASIRDLQQRYDALKVKYSRANQPRVSGKFTKK